MNSKEKLYFRFFWLLLIKSLISTSKSIIIKNITEIKDELIKETPSNELKIEIKYKI